MAAQHPIGKFQVLGTLGKGAHSSILHIRSETDSRQYALKVVPIDGRDEMELSYGLVAAYWGRGLATELARASLRIGFEVLGRPDLICFTLPTNRASQRVMEKAGFRYERDGVWADLPHVFYRQTAAEWAAEQGA